CMQSLEFPLSF
nr:immunoglobulin light chain junction region [Macaca mulatta]MOV86458.1 immunoglobulin light chain junction region [Macaca mulatta]